jgi:hypothetical protein
MCKQHFGSLPSLLIGPRRYAGGLSMSNMLLSHWNMCTYNVYMIINTGVIDIGGFTTDFLAVNQGGEVDYALARSVPFGIQSVINDFEESVRANNLEIVKDTPVLPPKRVRVAVESVVFTGDGREYPCQEEVDEATSVFLNCFADTYQRLAGGALSWDNIILTGGGSALLHHKLIPILKHNNIILADSKDTLHMANVRGGLKLWRLYDALKVL